MDVVEISLDDWREALPSRGYELFHEPAALSVLENHVPGELRLFGAYKGEHPVGLLPVFVTERPVGTTVVSPPTTMGVPRLGPLINPNSPKRSKHERINRTLAEGVTDALGTDGRTTLFRMVCPLDFTDPRPYEWQDFAVSPRFTYVVDVDEPDLDGVLSGFSRSLRNEMRRLDDTEVEITTEGIDSALRVYDDVEAQYDAHDDVAPMSRAFVSDLLAELDEDAWRVYVARDADGEYLSGIVTLFAPDLAYFWIGGVVATFEGVSVNNLLHRAILDDLVNDPALDSIEGYDLVGANTERLCEYKAKFNGRLRPYYVIESPGVEMQVAKYTYRKVGGVLGNG
ncbi:GNAT family N-acetyltransferase [Halovivax gelatinilyticus]|uniref:GNAT family N-acetyltransferase n=1 Tax=Halovivax gelatinilyticus TaxID=2961597 RepID=UPI0020CA8E38|nr:GNAT family N-acetyltransferase [Halovivax gelatinilyticus]